MIVVRRCPHIRRACPRRALARRFAGAFTTVLDNGDHLLDIARRDPGMGGQCENTCCDRSGAWTGLLVRCQILCDARDVCDRSWIGRACADPGLPESPE